MPKPHTPEHLTAPRSQMASSSCPLSPGPSGSKPRTTRASGVGFGGVMARTVAAVKLEPKPEPWAAGAEEGSAVAPRSMEGPPLPAPFVAKTYEMVADAATDAVVSWAPGGAGSSFVVWDPQALAAGILPRFFKHANFASFIRQLNIYVRTVSPTHTRTRTNAHMPLQHRTRPVRSNCMVCVILLLVAAS